MLDGFTQSEFTHDGTTRTVYRRGSGPGVLVMHEIPGITPEVAGFARRVADAGFSVAMPEMFGTTGKPLSNSYAVGQMARACISREFHVLAAHRSSPITDWLRALAGNLHDEIGGRGIGAIGMCITGNFALALMIDPWLMAPVLSQPSLPFPLSGERKAALHVSPEDLDSAKQRAVNEGVCVLGLRFTHDPMCPAQRFATLRGEFGDKFEGIEIDSSPGNPHGIPRAAHSVVTKDLVDEEGHPTRAALERVLSFFAEHLRSP
jgi:dienelactone hydrolase